MFPAASRLRKGAEIDDWLPGIDLRWIVVGVALLPDGMAVAMRLTLSIPADPVTAS
jgi:hypothetical protein